MLGLCCLEFDVELSSRRIRALDLPITRRMLRIGLTGSAGSSLLTLDASSVLMAPDGSRTIVWMIKRMIKAHPIENRMACRSPVVLCSGLDEVVVYGRRCGSGRRGAGRSSPRGGLLS